MLKDADADVRAAAVRALAALSRRGRRRADAPPSRRPRAARGRHGRGRSWPIPATPRRRRAAEARAGAADRRHARRAAARPPRRGRRAGAHPATRRSARCSSRCIHDHDIGVGARGDRAARARWAPSDALFVPGAGVAARPPGAQGRGARDARRATASDVVAGARARAATTATSTWVRRHIPGDAGAHPGAGVDGRARRRARGSATASCATR